MKNSISSDLIQLLDVFNVLDDMPVQNLYTCTVGKMGRVYDPHRIVVSVDSKKTNGLRADRIDDLSHHSTLQLNPLTEWINVTVSYFPKKNRPFRFYFRKDPKHINKAIAQLQIIPDLKNHKRGEEYIASWKILERASTIFVGKVTETKIRELLSSDMFQKACASQISRYLRLNNVKSKSYKVSVTPVTTAAHYDVTSKQQ